MSEVYKRVFRLERHALGPRVFVFGFRVHEWQLGLGVGLLFAVGRWRGLVSSTSFLGIAVQFAACWLVVKDWQDFFPGRRDRASWQLGLHRRVPPLRVLRRCDSLPALAALLVAVIGISNLVWALSPHGSGLDDLLPRVGPLASTPIFASFALPAGVMSVISAFYLLQRRRVAWALALALLLAIGLLELLHVDLGEAGLSFAGAGALWWAKDAFCVRPAKPIAVLLPRILSLVGASFLFMFVSLAAIAQLGGVSGARPAFALLSWRAAAPLSLPDGAEALPVAVRLLTLLVLVGACYLAFRVPAASGVSSERERRAAGELVREHGSDTLAFFKLRRDAGRLFSADGRAFLAYRVEAGVLLLSGDPVGSMSALPELLRGACAFAEEHGLRVAALGGREDLLPLYEQAGLRAFYVGDEAIVETARFSLEGRAVRKLRQSVNRLECAGYTTQVRTLGSLNPWELRELERVSGAWLGGRAERGFSMALGALDQEEHGDTVVVSACDADGVLRGFLHFVPSYGRAAVSLSAMRRDRETPNGLTEFLVVRALERFRETGIAEVSLNFAAFARLLHQPTSARDRLLARLISRLDPYFQIESLYRFNAKFFPHWEPRYLLYEGRLGFPRAALAALWAEGQIPRPRLDLKRAHHRSRDLGLVAGD